MTDPGKINTFFAIFYEGIYQSQGEPDLGVMEDFFENLGLPKLSGESSSSLHADINLNEAAGPDGFSVEFLQGIQL